MRSESACGYILQYPKYVLAEIVDGGSYTNTYLNNTANYTKSGAAVNGYYVYTKVS